MKPTKGKLFPSFIQGQAVLPEVYFVSFLREKEFS